MSKSKKKTKARQIYEKAYEHFDDTKYGALIGEVPDADALDWRAVAIEIAEFIADNPHREPYLGEVAVFSAIGALSINIPMESGSEATYLGESMMSVFVAGKMLRGIEEAREFLREEQ